MKYEVAFEPDEGGWHVFVPKIQGCRTWGRTLDAARRNIREAIAASMVDKDERTAVKLAQSAELVENIRLPAPARKALQRQVAARARSEAEAQKLAELTEEAAVALTKGAGLSLRDAGTLLNLSHTRVDQVLRKRAS